MECDFTKDNALASAAISVNAFWRTSNRCIGLRAFTLVNMAITVWLPNDFRLPSIIASKTTGYSSMRSWIAAESRVDSEAIEPRFIAFILEKTECET